MLSLGLRLTYHPPNPWGLRYSAKCPTPFLVLYPPVPRDASQGVANCLTLLKQCRLGSRMKQEHKRELEQIIGELQCPEDFKCYRMGFDDLCRAKDVGLELQQRAHSPQVLPDGSASRAAGLASESKNCKIPYSRSSLQFAAGSFNHT